VIWFFYRWVSWGLSRRYPISLNSLGINVQILRQPRPTIDAVRDPFLRLEIAGEGSRWWSGQYRRAALLLKVSMIT
jgi:hypothetical protein